MKKTMKQLPRGIRNKNPLNIRKSNRPWAGQISHDGKFCIFAKMEMGYRAAFILLNTYNQKYQLDGDRHHLPWGTTQGPQQHSRLCRKGVPTDRAARDKYHRGGLVDSRKARGSHQVCLGNGKGGKRRCVYHGCRSGDGEKRV